MRSLILSTATRYLLPLILLFSIFLLLRGHNESGGGFVGGLVASAGFALHTIAYGVGDARRVLRVTPTFLIGAGLLTSASSGVVGLMAQEAFLKGFWLPVAIPAIGHVGTPLLFDLGVYVLVTGVTLLILFSLAEE